MFRWKSIASPAMICAELCLFLILASRTRIVPLLLLPCYNKNPKPVFHPNILAICDAFGRSAFRGVRIRIVSRLDSFTRVSLFQRTEPGSISRRLVRLLSSGDGDDACIDGDREKAVKGQIHKLNAQRSNMMVLRVYHHEDKHDNIADQECCREDCNSPSKAFSVSFSRRQATNVLEGEQRVSHSEKQDHSRCCCAQILVDM